MSASKTGLSSAPKREPYNRPTVTKLTPQEAKATPGSENTQQLLDALKKRAPQAGVVRKIAFVVVLLFLLAVPVVLLVTALSADLALRASLVQFTVFWFPVWAVFAVWVTLDAVALYGFVGPRPDPLGPKALGLSALGLANIGAMLLFLFLTRGR